MEKKKRYLIIGIAALLGTIIGVTSAWYTWTSSNTNVTLTIGGITVTYNAGTDITGRNLRPVSTKEVGVTNNYAIKKDITVSSSKTTYFNLYLNAELFPVGLKHESLKWELYEGSTLLNSGNFGSTVQGDKITLLSNTEINSTTRSLSLYIWIDGNMSNPSTMQNQTYRFVLNADATDEEQSQTAAEYLTAFYNTGTATIEEDAGNGTEYEYRKDISMMTDIGGNLRYYGANPDNYVMFNNEQWRIIGVFNNIDDGEGNLETRVKIARAEPLLERYKWNNLSTCYGSSIDWARYESLEQIISTPIDTSYCNGWGTTSLQIELNGNYLNSITNTSNLMIGDAIWNTGIVGDLGYVDGYYSYERNDNISLSHDGTTWKGKIGLMYLSDYMYAGDLISCTKAGFHWDKDQANCRDKSWLGNSNVNKWTLSRSSELNINNGDVFYIAENGAILSNTVSDLYYVQPVLFLNSNVAIVDGSGKPGDEFILE